MSRYLRIALTTAAFILIPVPGLAAQEISVSEVIDGAAELNGEVISVRGELVGDFGKRDDGWTWTQLNGDVYVDAPIREGGVPQGSNTGIGVRIPTEFLTDLGPPGGYRHRGPVVRVEGEWSYHDPERQGESYLQVESLVVVEPGYLLTEVVDWLPAVLGFLLVAMAALVALFIGRRDEAD